VRLRCRHDALHTTTDTDGDESVDRQSKSRPEPTARPAGNDHEVRPCPYDTAAEFESHRGR
jgi:hypothetical protein